MSAYKSPREAFHAVANRAVFTVIVAANRRSPFGGPGAMVSRQPENVRALLRELRSDDITDVADWWVKVLVGARP